MNYTEQIRLYRRASQVAWYAKYLALASLPFAFLIGFNWWAVLPWALLITPSLGLSFYAKKLVKRAES